MSMAKGAITGLAGALAIDAFIEAGKRAFDYADSIVDLSDRTGAATKTIQEFRYAAQLSGSSVEDADVALGKFVKNLGGAQNGGDAMAKILRALGVTTTNVDDALRQAIDGISKLPTVAQRNAKAMELFGASAGTLTLLLSGGSKGFDELAAKAESLGIVLQDDLLRNAGQVNDKLDTMKLILDAQFASGIIQNADAIANLADNFIRLTTAALNAFSAISNMGNLDILRNPGFSRGMSSLLGNDGEKTLNQAQKELLGNQSGRRDLFNLSTEQRRDLAIKYGVRSNTGKVDVATYNSMSAQDKNDYNRLTRNRNDAYAAQQRANLPTPSRPRVGNDLQSGDGKPKTPKAKAGPSAEKLAEKEAARLESYYKEMESARMGMLSEQLRGATEVSKQADIQRSMLDIEHKGELDAIDANVKTKKLREDEADKLRELIDAKYAVALENIGGEEAEKLAKERLSMTLSGLDNERDLLQASQDLARTAKARRDGALKLIDLQFKQEKLQLEAIVASQDSTEAEKAIARARLAILDRLKGQSVERAKQDTQGPLASYVDSLPRSMDEINEALERVQVDGLTKLEDGFVGLIDGTKKWGDVFKDVSGSIISGIARIVIQQAIVKPLGALLVGGDSGGGGALGGLLGSILKKTVTAGVTGARANGGYTAPGTYLVGERGPELAQFGSSANVVPTSALRALNRASNDNGITVNIGDITSNDPDAIRRATMEAIAVASPMLRQQAVDATISKLQRRTM